MLRVVRDVTRADRPAGWSSGAPRLEGAAPVEKVGVATASVQVAQPSLRPAERRNVQGALPIDVRLMSPLQPIADSMRPHWSFLYRRADPEAAESKEDRARWTVRRTEINALGVDHALQALEAKGHKPGTGKVLVFGGGYEVDLRPLLEKFAEVHVVDLSDDPLRLVDRKYRDSPHRAKLRLVQADLSGVPHKHQAKELARVRAEGGAPDPEKMGAYHATMPAKLAQLPFGKGEFAMVVSPVLTESLPYGPAVCAFEEARALRSKTSAEPEARRSVDSHLGEGFFYRPEVMSSFAHVFHHHSKELRRLLAGDGVAVFSSWMRPDEQQAEHAPGAAPLLRVGDTRASQETWSGFFAPWSRTTPLIAEKVHGPETKPVLNLFVMEK